MSSAELEHHVSSDKANLSHGRPSDRARLERHVAEIDRRKAEGKRHGKAYRRRLCLEKRNVKFKQVLRRPQVAVLPLYTERTLCLPLCTGRVSARGT